MKVVFITSTFPDIKCGVADYAYNLIKSMKGFGHEFHILTSDDPSIIDKSDFCSIHKRMKLWTIREFPIARKVIDGIKPDIVHIHHDSVPFKTKKMLLNIIPIYLRSIDRDIKIITTIHEFREHRLRWKFRILPNLFFSDKLILVDLWDLKMIKRQFAFIPANKLTYIPIASNIIPPKKYVNMSRSEIRKSLGLGADDMLIFHFGEIVPHKGVDLLLHVFERIAPHNRYAKLLLISNMFGVEYRMTPYQKSVSKKIEENIFRNRIITLAGQDAETLSRYMLASDIAVFPFTFGVTYQRGTFLASLAHGLPTLTTYHPSFYPPMITDGKDAVLVKINDEKSLLDKLEVLIRDEGMREKIGVSARKFYEMNFSWSSIGRKMDELYHKFNSLR